MASCTVSMVQAWSKSAASVLRARTGVAATPPTPIDADTTNVTLKAAAQFRHDRIAEQQVHISRLASALPLPRLALPFVFSAALERAEIDLLARALIDSIVKL